MTDKPQNDEVEGKPSPWLRGLILCLALVALGGLLVKGTRVLDHVFTSSTPVPAFSVPLLENPDVHLTEAAFQNHAEPVLVNVFASWCGPCIEEHPLLMDLAETHGVTIYGVSMDMSAAAARKFLEAHGNPYTQAALDEGFAMTQAWEVYGLPSTLVVDNNTIIHRHTGPITDAGVMEKLLGYIDG